MVTKVTPNLRQFVVPDPGYVWLDCDLSKADAQVVAAEAGELELRGIFAKGVDVYTERGSRIGVDYKASKMGIHAVDYACKARTLGMQMGCSTRDAQEFIDDWYSDYPGILRWHQEVREQLEKDGSVANRFGFRKYYFGKPDEVLSQALAWIPQSTVAIVTHKGALRIERELPQAQLLLQVHDSLDIQVPKSEMPDIKEEIKRLMTVEIPYDPPLYIGVGVKESETSWGDVA